jgi:peptidoglycan/LPS O-acetylase OafA/YrhL
VLLVVGFHLWPDQLRGGFAGVDVFFVISGFLITSHLARELAAEGTVRLPAFYARRARRLLPAALTVLLAGAVGVFALVPMTLWAQSFHEIMASALYFENWSLAAGSIDYFAAENPPTLVQHFWSLSVEEQFYLAWPLLFLLAAAGGRRVAAGRGPNRVLASFPVLVLVLSFGWSALHHGSGAEYFSTFTRAWEFAAGGLLALTVESAVIVRLLGSPGARRIVGGLGWTAVLGSGVLLSQTWRFPGWIAAIPVLGTVAVIAAGGGAHGSDWPARGPVTGGFLAGGSAIGGRLIRSRPIQFTGGISYSLYLWHWPVIILFGREPGGIEDSGTSRWLLLAAGVLLAVASTYLIEAPVRRYAPGRRRAGRTLGVAAAGMAAVCLVCLVGQARVNSMQAAAERQVAAIRKNPPECFGAAALDPLTLKCAIEAQTTEATGAELPVPDPLAAFDDKPKTCMQSMELAALRICSTGPAAAAATRQVAVVGDSHAMAWMPALQQVARARGWRLTALLKGSCPLTQAVREMDSAAAASCVAWNDAVHAWLAEHPGIDEVIVTASSKNTFVPAPGRTWQQTAVQGYRRAWDALPDSVTRIVVLRDVPRPRPDVVTCAQSAVSAGRAVRACGRSQSQALLEDPQVAAVAQADRKPQLIDLSRYFCADGYCSPQIGGAFVYRDGHHLTATFSRTLAPYLSRELGP